MWSPTSAKSSLGRSKEAPSIFAKSEEEALNTLKHELLDYAISQVIMPCKEVTNKLISLINEEAYKRKEQLVAALNKVL
jgi:hypothetical protein